MMEAKTHHRPGPNFGAGTAHTHREHPINTSQGEPCRLPIVGPTTGSLKVLNLPQSLSGLGRVCADACTVSAVAIGSSVTVGQVMWQNLSILLRGPSKVCSFRDQTTLPKV